MSAQRRTATKRDARTATVPTPGAVPAAPRSRRAGPPPAPVERPVPERAKVAEPTRRSVLSERVAGVRRLYDDTRSEMRKINWPDQKTTKDLTVVVIGISIALGILLGGIDWILFQLFELTT